MGLGITRSGIYIFLPSQIWGNNLSWTSIIYKKHNLSEVKCSYLVSYCIGLFTSCMYEDDRWVSNSGRQTWYQALHSLNLLMGPNMISVNGNKTFCLGCFFFFQRDTVSLCSLDWHQTHSGHFVQASKNHD